MTNPFRRYTNLAATIHLLQTKQITLLNPATWDDRNDAYYMAEYKRLRGLQTVLAICFAEQSETYHHWRVFSHGSGGICIEFEKEALLSAFDGPNIKKGSVHYMLIKDLKKKKEINIERLPFMKRAGFEDEQEYRVVYLDKKNALEAKDFGVDVMWIRRITLSPWMPKAFADSVRRTLRSIRGCSDIQISRSSLIENETWKGLTSRAVV